MTYNVTVASLLDKKMSSKLHTMCTVDLDDLVEACNDQWGCLWHLGSFASGDETIVPHTGKQAG